MEDEDRQKKLLAGKQKLAAYRKKKNKPKKLKSASEGTDSEVTESEASSVIDLADIGSLSDLSDASLTGLSTEALQQGKEPLHENYEELKISPRSMETARRELARAHDRVTELEETLLGKEALLESLVKENEQLKSDLLSTRSQGVTVTAMGVEGDFKTPAMDTEIKSLEDSMKKIKEYQSAILQRDEVIKQLSENLKATTENRDTLQLEYQAQAEQLASQVHLLQEQLRQTGDWLNQHSGEQGISAAALLEAKNELLALQQVNKEKDSQIIQLQSAMQERDQTITHLVEKFNSSAENFEKMKTAYIHLQQEAMLLKHEKSNTSGGKLQLELTSLKKSYNEVVQQLSQTTEIQVNFQVIQKENEDLKTKNERLKQKEKESGHVIKHLMGNIETLQKGTVPISPISPTSPLSSSSLSDIEHELSSLRAELEESHGEQIVQMKEQLQDQHKMEIDRLNRELGMVKGERDKLSTQVKEWQNMYMSLSQTGASGADLSMEIHALRTENSMYKDHIIDLSNQIESLKKENVDLKTHNVVANIEDNKKYQKQVAELSSELHSLHYEKDNVLSELQNSQEKLGQLDTVNSKLKTYETMVETLEEKLNLVVKEKEESVLEIERLKSSLQNVQEKTGMLLSDLDNRQENLGQVQSDLDSTRKKFEEAEKLLSHEQEELKQTLTHYSETENELLKTRAMKIKLDSDLELAKQDIENVKEAHRQEMLVVQSQFEMRLKMEVEESVMELQKSKLEIETLKATNTGSSNQNTEIENLQSKYQAEIDRVKTEYTQYIQQVQATYEAQFKSAQEHWQNTEATRVQTLQEQISSIHKNQLDDLQEQLTLAHNTIREGALKIQELVEQLQINETKHKKELDKIVQDLNKQHQEEILLLQKQNNAGVVVSEVDSNIEYLDTCQLHTEIVQGASKETALDYQGRHIQHTETVISSHVHHQSSSVVSLSENISEQRLSVHSSDQTDSGVSLLETESSRSGITSVSDVHFADSASESNVVNKLQSQITELQTQLDELQEINQSLKSQLDNSTPKDVHSESVQSDQNTKDMQNQAYEQQIAMLLQQNEIAHDQIKVMSVELSEKTKKLSEKSDRVAKDKGSEQLKNEDVFEIPVENSNAQESQMVKVEVFSTKEVSTSIGDEYEDHYTSALDITANVSTTSDAYISASETSCTEAGLSASDLRERLNKAESEKQHLAKQIKSVQNAMDALRAKCDKLERNNTSLIEEKAKLSVEMEMSTEETLSELKLKIDEMKTEKASLETVIFYKDLEISKLSSETGEKSQSRPDLKQEVSKEQEHISDGKKDMEQENINNTLLQLREHNDILQKELDTKDTNIKQLKNHVEVLQADYDRLMMKVADEDFQIERLNVEAQYFKQTEKESWQLKKKINTLEDEKGELNATIDELEIDIGELKVDIDCKDNEIQELKKEVTFEVNSADEEVDGNITSSVSAGAGNNLDPSTDVVLDEKLQKESIQASMPDTTKTKDETMPVTGKPIDESMPDTTKTKDETMPDTTKTKDETMPDTTKTNETMPDTTKTKDETIPGTAKATDETKYLELKEALTSEINKSSELTKNLNQLELDLSARVKMSESLELEMNQKVKEYETKIVEMNEQLNQSHQKLEEWNSRSQIDTNMKKLESLELEMDKKLKESEVKIVELNEQLNQSHQNLQEINSRTETKLTSFEDTIDQLTTKNTDLTNKHLKLESVNTELELKLQEATKTESRLTRELKHFKTVEEDLTEKCKELEIQGLKKEESNESNECKIQQLQCAEEKLKEELTQFKVRYEDTEGKLRQSQTTLAALNGQFEQVQTEKDKINEQMNDTTKQKSELMETLNAVKSEKSELVEKIAKLELNSKEAVEQLQRSENEKEAVSVKSKHDEEVISALTVQCAELRQDKKDMEEKIGALKNGFEQQMTNIKDDQAKVLSHYESLIQSLTSEKGDFSAEFEQMREMLEEKQSLVIEMQEEIATLRLTNDSLILEQEKEVERLMNQKNELESQKVDALEKVQDLQNDLRSAKQVIEEQKYNNAENEKNNARLDTQIKEMEKEKGSQINQLSEKETMILTLQDDSLSLQQTVDEKESTIKELSCQLEELQEEKENNLKHLDDKEHCISSLEKEKTDLQKSLSENLNTMQAREKMSEDIKACVEEAEKEKHNLEEKLLEQISTVTALQNENCTLKTFVTELESTAEAKQKSIEELETRNKVLNTDGQIYTKQISEKESVISSLQGELSGLQNYITELNADMESKDKTLKEEIQINKDELSNKLSQKESDISSLQGEVSGLQNFISELKTLNNEKEDILQKTNSDLKEAVDANRCKEESISSLENEKLKLQKSLTQLENNLEEKEKCIQMLELGADEKDKEISTLQKQVSNLKILDDEKNKKVEDYNKIVGETLEKVESLSLLIEQKESKLTSVSEEKETVLNTNQKLEQALKEEKMVSSGLLKTSESLQQQIENLKSVNAKLLERVKTHQNQLQVKTSEVDCASEKMTDVQKKLSVLEEEKMCLEVSSTELKNKLCELEDEKVKLQKACSELNTELDKSKEMQKQTSVEANEQREQTSSLQLKYDTECQKLQSDLKEIQERNKCLEEENSLLNSNIRNVEETNKEELEKVKIELNNVIALKTEKEEKYTNLETERDVLNNFVAEKETEIQALKVNNEESKHQQQIQYEQLSKHCDSVGVEKQDMQKSLQMIEDEKLRLLDKVQSVENQNDDLKTQNEKLKTDVEKIMVEKEEMGSKLSEITCKYKLAEQDNNSFKKTINDKESALQVNQEKVFDLETKVTKLHTEMQNLSAQQDSTVGNLKANEDKLQQELSNLSDQWEKLNSANSVLEKEIESLKIIRDENERMNKSLIEEKDSLKNEITDLKAQMEVASGTSEKMYGVLKQNFEKLQEERQQVALELGNHIESLRNEKETLLNDNKKYKADVENLQTKMQNMTDEINSLQKEQELMQKENCDLKNNDLPKLKQTIASLVTEKTTECEKVANLNVHLETIVNEKEHLLKTIKDLENNIETIKSGLTSEKSDLSNELCSLKCELEKEMHEKSKMQEKLDNFSKKIETLEKGKSNLESDLNNLQADIDRLLQEHETTASEYDEVVLKNKSLQEDLRNISSKLQTTESCNCKLEEELRNTTENVDTVSANLVTREQEILDLGEKITHLSEQNITLNSDLDLMRSENLSLKTEKEHDKEKDSSVIADLNQQVSYIKQEKDTIQSELANVSEQFKSLRKTHSDAIGELEKEVKNLYNLAERLEKENTKLQNRVVETVNESDALKEKLEDIQSEHHTMKDQFREKLAELQKKESDTENLQAKLQEMEVENDSLKVKMEKSHDEMLIKVKILEEENEKLKKQAESSIDDDTSNEDMSGKYMSDKDSVDSRHKSLGLQSLELKHQELQEKLQALQNDLKQYQEERQLMEASMENIKYERDHLKDQVEDLEKSIKDSSDGEYVNVSVRYEQEITTLKRSLETVMSEREAMKETFEEDLTRLSRQVEEKENERIHLQHEIESLRTDSGMLHSTPRGVEIDHQRIRHSTNDSTNNKPMLLSAVGTGLMSESMQFESEDLQMLHNLENDPQHTSTEGQSLNVDCQEYTTSKKIVQTAANFGGFGIFSDSCKLQTSDFESVDPVDLQELKESRVNAESTRPDQSPEPAVKVDGSVREVIERYEQRLNEMKEQHAIELKVAEYNMNETYTIKMKQLRVNIQTNLEEEYKQKSEELNNHFEQKINSAKQELQANFVAELQKARQEIERSRQTDLDKDTFTETAEVSESEDQITDEVVMLRRQLERLEEAKIELLGSIDSYNNREAGFNEEILALTEAKDYLATENVKLKQELSLYTDHATVESTSEFNTEEWRVKYDSVLKQKELSSVKSVLAQNSPFDQQEQQASNLNDIGDGSLPTSQEINIDTASEGILDVEGGLQLDSADQDELRHQLDILLHENESLKLKLRNQSLGIEESMRKELLDAQFKYQMILQEKENLLRHFHRLGINPSALSVEVDADKRRRSQSHDTDITEDSLNEETVGQPELEEDFIDWKLKYEIVEKENELLKSKLHSSAVATDSPKGSRDSPSLNTTPQFVISTDEFKSRHSALVEQNEMLRAHLGTRGMYIDRSLEGDTLDMHFQLETLANENEKLKQHLEDYDKDEYSSNMLQAPSPAGGSKSRISSESSDVNWRYMFETLCKEHEEVKCELAKLKEMPVSNKSTEDESVLSEIRNAIEDDNSLTRVDKDDKKFESLLKEYETIKSEMSAAKDKAKKDLTKMKAKNVVANKEIEKLKKKLQSYESQESVVSVMSTASDSSTAEDSGFVVVDKDNQTVGSENVSISSEKSVLTSKNTVETIVKETFKEVQSSSHKEVHTSHVSFVSSGPPQIPRQYQDLELEIHKLKEENRQLQQSNTQLQYEVQSMLPKESKPTKQHKKKLDSDLLKEIEQLKESKTQIQDENKELKSKMKKLQETDTLESSQQHDRYTEHQNMKSQYAESAKKVENLKSQLTHDKEWHDAEMQGLQEKYELVVTQRKDLESRYTLLTTEKEEIKRDLVQKLSESEKQLTELKSQVLLNEAEKQRTCDKLIETEEKLQLAESCKADLENEIEQFSVSEKTMQVKNSQIEFENASLKEQLSMLQSSVDSFNSASSIRTMHDSDLPSRPSNSSTNNCNDTSKLFIHSSTGSDSSVCNQGMNVHESLVHGSPLVPGEGIYTSVNLGQNKNIPQNTSSVHIHIQTDITLKPDQLFQITSPNKEIQSKEEKISSITSQVGFQPIPFESPEHISKIEPEVKSVEDLLKEMEELQEQHNVVIQENSQLMHLVEDLETQLSDAKYELSHFESISSNEVEQLITKVGSSEFLVPEIESRKSKTDESTFYIKDAVRVSITEELGEDSDTGRVVDIQTISPTKIIHEESVPTTPPRDIKLLTSDNQTSRSPSTPFSAKRSVTPKQSDTANKSRKPVKVKGVKQETKRPGFKSRNEKSNVEMNIDAVQKETQRLTKENSLLSEKVSHMNKVKSELSSLKVKYDRACKEKKDLQAKYDRDAGKSTTKKKVEGDDLKKTKHEKIKLEKEIAGLRNQLMTKEKENQELLQLLHQNGQSKEEVNITQLRIQYEILLTEKEQMSAQFEEEKHGLMENIREMENRLEVAEVTQQQVLESDLSSLNGSVPSEEEVVRLRRHLSDVNQQKERLEEEKCHLNQEIQKMKHNSQNLRTETHRDKLDFQQKVNDLNAKIDVMEVEDKELRSQLQLAKIEKTEIKSELEERLKQLEQQNKEQQFVINANTEIKEEASGLNYTDHYSVPLSLEIPTMSSQYTQMPSGSSTSSSKLSQGILSPASQRTEHSVTSLDFDTDNFSLSEIRLQYEILMQEKRELCAKLQRKEDRIKEIQLQVEETVKQLDQSLADNEFISKEYESHKIQYELLHAEKNELCTHLDQQKGKVTDLKERIRTVTEQLLESQRESQSLHSSCDTLRRELLHSAEPADDCFETEEESLAKSRAKDLEGKVFELSVKLEKVEQDLETNTHKLTQAHRKVEETGEEKRQSFVKLEKELHGERQRLQSLKDEFEDVKFKYDELDTQAESLQQENESLVERLSQLSKEKEKVVSELQTLIEELQVKNISLLNENENLKLGLAQKEKEVADKMDELQEALDDCLSGKQKLWAEIKELKSKLKESESPQSEQRMDEEQKETKKAQEQSDSLQNQVLQLKEENAALCKDIIDARTQIEEVTMTILKITTENDTLKDQKISLEKSLLTFQNHAKEVNDNIIAIHEEYEKLTQERMLSKEQAASLSFEIKQCEEKISTLTAQKENIFKEKTLIAEELEQLKEKNKFYVGTEEALMKQVPILQNQLEEVEEGKGKQSKDELDLTRQEKEILHSELDVAKQNNLQLPSMMEKQQEEIEIKESELQKETEYESLNRKHAMLTERVETEPTDLNKQVLDLKYVLEMKIRENKETEERCLQLQSEVQNLQAVVSEVDSELKSSKLQIENTEQENVGLKIQNEQVSRDHAVLLSEMNTVKSRLASVEDESNQKKIQIDALTNDKTKLEKEVENLQKALRASEDEKSSSEISLKQIKEDLNRIRTDYDIVNKEKVSLQTMATDANIQLSDLEIQIARLKTELLESKADNQKLLEKLDKSNETKSGETTTSKEENSLDDISHSCNQCQKISESFEKLKKSYEELESKYHHGMVPPDVDKTDDVVDIGADLNLSDLQEENAQLFKQKNELENQLMALQGDNVELAEKFKYAGMEYKKELEVLKERLDDYKSLCDTISISKEKLGQELESQRNEFETKLTKLRLEKFEKSVKHKDNLDNIVQQIADSERRVAELKDDLRTVEEEKGLLQLKVAHLMRECKLYERHIKDLEKEVEMQVVQIQDAMHEHKETIRMLAELRLEQEMSKKEHKGEFSKIEGKLKRLETEISTNRSTPVAASIASAPVYMAQSPNAQSLCSLNDEGRVRSDFGFESDGDRALSLKHFQMIEELNKLHRELQESKQIRETLIQENKSLRETVQNERAKSILHMENSETQFLDSSIDRPKSRHNSGTPINSSRRNSSGTVDFTNIPAEMLSLKERVIFLQANNKKLVQENELLRSQLLRQESLFEELENEARKGKANDVERVLTQQITLLKQQRDELLKKTEEMKYISASHNNVLEEKSKLQDSLRWEKELVRQRTHEKDKLEIELLRERLSLERQIREQHRLEELIKHKDMLERELYRQKEHLEGELDMAEIKLKKSQSVGSDIGIQKNHASEGQIQEEMGRVSLEIQRKVKSVQSPDAISSPVCVKLPNSESYSYKSSHDKSYQSSSSGHSSRYSRRHGSGGRHGSAGSSTSSSSRKLKLDCGCVAELDTMKMMAQCHYHIAVEKLRTDLSRIDSQRKSKRK